MFSLCLNLLEVAYSSLTSFWHVFENIEQTGSNVLIKLTKEISTCNKNFCK